MSKLVTIIALFAGSVCALMVASGPRVESDVEPRPVTPPAATSSARPGPVNVGQLPRLHGPTQNSVSAERGLCVDWPAEGPPELWRISTGTGYSSPIAWDNRVIVHSRQSDHEVVACLDAETGETQWTHQTPTSFACDWPPYSSGPYSTPVTDGSLVLTLGAEGVATCLSLASGNVVWSRRLNDEYKVPTGTFAVGHSPLVWGNRIALNIGGRAESAGIVCLDKQSGREIWRTTQDPASYSSPVLMNAYGRKFLLTLTGHGLVVVDPESGNVQDTRELHAPSIRDAPSAVTPLVIGNRVIVSVYQVGTFCFQVESDGTLYRVWKQRRAFETQFNPMTFVDDRVLGWHVFDQSLRAFELETGTLLWKWKSRLRRGTHILVADSLVVLGEDGHLGCARPDRHGANPVTVTSQPVLDKPCYSAPALSHGRLIVRNEKHVACFDLRAAANSD